jgi:ribosomal protein L35AE/L33A
LKNKIQENIKKTDDNVYIFIDDLDRCNTNFVIKLFEITKHLFNIKNVVIIYMLDLNNINHSIIKYYNLLEDNNANETYLSKIIDYVHNLEDSVIEQETFGNKIPREHNYSTRKNINRIISFFENIYKEAGIGSTFPYKNFSSINLTQFFKIDFKKLILIAINTG